MQQEQFIKALLSAARQAGIAEAEVYARQEESMRVLVSKGEIEEYAVNTSGGLSLRGLVNGKMGSAYTEAMDEEAIPMLVRGVLESGALIDDEDEQFIYAGGDRYETVDTTGDLGTPAERIDLALRVEKLARTMDPRVRELGLFTGMQSERGTVRIVNTRGLDLSRQDEGVMAYVESVAREGEKVATYMALSMARNLSEIDPEAVAREAVEEAVFQLDAEPCESGEMPVIFRNTAMASLLGVFSGVFSADAAQKDLSLLKGKEGTDIAAPCVTLMDDPLLKTGFASRPFDAEGVATRTKAVIEGGLLTTLLHNLKTAKKAGVSSTGNAARAGYAGAVTVAPSNFFFKPGETDLQGLEAMAGRGLVITDVEGLHAGANEISGDFSLLAKGYLVENGRKGRPVQQVTVAGNFFALLLAIQAAGSDLRFPGGGVGSPSVLVKSLSIAGK